MNLGLAALVAASAPAYASIAPAQALGNRTTASLGQDLTLEKACGEGGICAIVCMDAQEKTPRAYFADFAVIGTSGRVHRTIIDRLGYSPDEQIRQKIDDLTEADHMMSDLFDNAMEHVKRTTEFKPGEGVTVAANSCAYKRLASYSPAKRVFVADEDLYKLLSATDRAGFWTHIAFDEIAVENGRAVVELASQTSKLVQQVFFGAEEDHDRVKLLKVEPLTKDEKFEKIRELFRAVVPEKMLAEES